MGLQEVLDIARKTQQIRDLENKEEIERERKAMSSEYRAQKELFPRLRPANVKDYLLWLKGYIENGGKPSHVYNYPFSRWNWYVAVKHIEPVALHGARAISIIIPAGISVGVGDWGHCNLFYMDGCKATSLVPIFEDTNFSEG